MIKVKLLNEKAVAPTKGTPGAAGWDLYATSDTLIVPGTSEVVGTGIALEIPNGWVGVMSHRSSLGFKLDTIASFGIIDSDYRGEVKVKLFNIGVDGVRIKSGDRIAQIVVVPHYHQQNMVVVDSLEESVRGAGGVGSTGV